MINWIAGDPSVPSIDDDALNLKQERFRPLVKEDENLFEIESVDARATAFTWSPVTTKQVRFIPLMEVETDHYCGYHAFFKPSIAEVLAQAPEELPDEANAYYIEIDSVACYESGRGHRATTIFGIAQSD